LISDKHLIDSNPTQKAFNSESNTGLYHNKNQRIDSLSWVVPAIAPIRLQMAENSTK